MSIELLERIGSLKVFHSPNEFVAFQDLITKDTFVILEKEIRAIRDLFDKLLSKHENMATSSTEIEVERFSYIIQQETN